jgi:4-hydroxybenzoate polyprenyltransferase
MAIRTLFEFIKFPHTLFALPFAMMAYLVACEGKIDPLHLLPVLVAMVAARTAAMTYNRIVDREIDARNPRTRDRALVTGELALRSAWLLLSGSSVLFLAAAWFLGRLPFICAPFVLAVLFLYSYTKRFTDLSHFILGFCLGMAPMGAWIAVRGSLGIAPVVLALGVLLWTAGFDLIYACQDIEVDRSQGLRSMAARLGAGRALLISAILHFLCLPPFIIFGILSGLGFFYTIGTVIAAVFLVYQHVIISPTDLSRADRAFFAGNGAMSVVLFLFAALDLYKGSG